MKINELFTNDTGRLSTTSTIQMMSATTLCVGFFLSMFFSLNVPIELAMILAVLGGATGFSKGYIDSRKGKSDGVD